MEPTSSSQTTHKTEIKAVPTRGEIEIEVAECAGLSAHMVSELTEVFKVFDRNGDGKISQAELGSVLQALGENPSNAELRRMVEEVDMDGDGFINLQEFISLNLHGSGVDGPETAGTGAAFSDVMESAFHSFDLDGNGVISAEELHSVLKSLGDTNLTLEECHYMIRSVDTDGDGLVDFKDFQNLMRDTCVYWSN